jgi:diguanylate cyclase (GGDEF)-like protein
VAEVDDGKTAQRADSSATPWLTSRDAELFAWHALHDAMTGLPRTTIVLDRLRGALARAQRSQLTAGVLVFGVDRIGKLNDELGWEAGNEVLRLVASRLMTNLRSTDVAGRIGGDEFAVICDALATWEDAAAIAERLDDAISTPMLVADRVVLVTSCIGVAITADGTEDPERLLHRAYLAMRHEKRLAREQRGV